MTEQELIHYFTYHPPQNQERKQAHEAINQGALEFAKVVLANVNHPRLQQSAFDLIQQARMFANHGVAMDELMQVESIDFDGERHTAEEFAAMQSVEDEGDR